MAAKKKPTQATATGTVNTLDATPLDDPSHEHAGKVLITIVCDSIDEGRAWAELYGKRITASEAP